MKKFFILLFVLLLSSAKANEPNMFNEKAEEAAQTNTYSTDNSTDSPAVPPSGVQIGGNGGNGTGEVVSIDMYQVGLLVAAVSLIFYKMNIIRRQKVILLNDKI